MIRAYCAIVRMAKNCCLLPLILCASSTIAAPDESAVTETEVVSVVGSHIPQVDATGLSPVLVMDRQSIEATGAMYLSEVLQQLPLDNNGTFNDRDPLSSALGGSGISLRGLGANSVLVLVNGRRVVSYGFSQQPGDGALVSFVDLNSIPVAAVERVEILKDGASAMYGSDAVAGVINIVLRDRYSGAELQARGGEADGGGAEERALSGMFGWVGERSNIELIVSYSKRNPLAWSDRDISASANHEPEGGLDLRDIAASNFLIDAGLSAFGADCENRDTAFEEVDDGICLYNPNQAIVQPKVERAGATVIANHAFTDSLTLHFEGSYLRSELEGRLAPTELNGATFPAQNPWNSFGQDAETFYQFTETGPRVSNVDTDNYRAVAVLEGQRGDWIWEIGGLYHRADTNNRGEGQLSAVSVEAALRGVDFNGDGILQDNEYLNLVSPVSNPSSSALIDSLLVSTHRKAKTELAAAFAKVVGQLMALPAGNLILAFGLDHTYESLLDRSDPVSLADHVRVLGPVNAFKGYRVDLPFDLIDPYAYIDVRGGETIVPSGAPLAKGFRNRDSAFAELQIPLVANLEVQVALRLDLVKGLDAELTPRIALRYQPFAKHALRASWGQGFRAPSLAEQHTGASTKLQFSWDPELCPTPGFLIPELAGGCVANSFVTVSGGSSDLEPESSETWSVGVNSVFSERMATALDCWHIKVNNRIVALGPERILRYERMLHPDAVIRRPPEPFQVAAGIPGYTDFLNNAYLNAASQKVYGCDLEIDTDIETERYGAFGAQLIGTHMASNKLRILPGIPSEQLAGSFGYPKNRVNVNLSWLRRSWRAGLQGRYTDSFDDNFSSGHVDSHTEWDAQLGFQGHRGYRLTFGIENLFDEDPPQAFGLQGFTQQYYDMRGRFFYAQASLSFSALRPADSR